MQRVKSLQPNLMLVMKKRIVAFLFFYLAVFTALYAEPFFVRVNGATDYPASNIGETDYQGRVQYLASPIPLQSGDVITIFDEGNNAEWAIANLDPYGAFEGFTASASGITCNADGCYSVYVKMKYQDDIIYIEEATGCDESGENPDPDPEPEPDPDPDEPSDGTYQPGDFASSVPSQSTDVMLQAFYWDSYSTETTKAKYGTTQWSALNEQASEMAAYFDLVWIAPSAKSSGGTGYHPSQWCNQNSAHGSRAKLEQLIANLHAGGAKVIADIVVNHRDNKSSWCDFWAEDFGEYGQFQLTAEHICRDDEVNTSGTGSCKGAATGANDTGEKYAAARDLDHTNPYVQNAVKAYLKWMKDEMKYDGWRFDVAKGFSAQYFGQYIEAAQSYFSVGEYLDGNYDLLNGWVNGTGNRSTAFDFSLKFNGLNNGLAKGDLSKLVWMNGSTPQPAGMIHSGLKKYAVTLVDNHDTFERANGNDFAAIGSKDLILQANAFILSSPGIPCVFYPHWVRYKEDIKKMILARKAVGVHNESAVVVNDYGSNKYVATVTGKNGTLMVKIGSGSGSNVTPDGYTKAASGNNWAMYIKTNAAPAPKLIVNPAGGKYVGGVTVTLSALNATDIYYTLDGTEPTTTSIKYTTPIEIGTTNTTLKAFAVGDGGQTEVQTHVYETEARTEPITVKFRKPADWSTVYMWAWASDSENTNVFPGGDAKWPGAAITDEGNGWWSHTFDIAVQEVNVIFNDGKASGAIQTEDIYTDESACYEFNAATSTAIKVDCESTAVLPVQAEKAFMLYPNPVENELNVSAKNAINRIRIYSATGQLVWQQTIQATEATIDVEHLQKGIYFMQAQMGDNLTSSRFIKK